MIKTFENWLVEINMTQARKATEIFLSSGGKKRYNEIFNGQDRIYYDFRTGENVTSKVANAVVDTLSSEGYTLLDYLQGTCYKNSDPRRTLKAQRVLFKLGKEELAQKMNIDPIRDSSKTTSMKVVISKHGIDLAGQSQDRDWDSCKNLSSGMNAKYTWSEIQAGALVAYLIKSGDTNIKKPIARQTIAVFRLESDNKTIAFFPTSQVYGNYRGEDFPGFVYDWCKEANKKISSLSGQYFIDPACHTDGVSNVTIIGNEKVTLKTYIDYVITPNHQSSSRAMPLGNIEIKNLEDIFTEISKLPQRDAHLFLKNMKIESSALADLLEKAEIEDLKTMLAKHFQSIGYFLILTEKDWNKISKKRTVEIYDIYEKYMGKEDMEETLRVSRSPASRFLKMAYSEKYKK